ncbi:hypothetical protein [Yokenella regensburgei]|uniref:hypothetical protein n=1 Tax=Yokenella regensburgei TaxID=158877 RepID=UPI000241F72C|nr:hypothetical protein [Yokenella regensburgei]EHM46036.1 hypothetical protein HMPREF0880_04087 [Yokenella regensburgei ATCC 43003]
MIDKYRLDDLRLESGEKGELARWVIQLQTDLDYERRKISTPPAPVVQQEPIAWLNDAYLGRGVVDGEAGSEDQGPGYIPVYREPYTTPSAPVAPELSELEAVFQWIMELPIPTYGATKFAKRLRKVIEGCRAAMLQAEQQNAQQNIPENIPTLREAVDTIRSSGIAIDSEKILAERYALCWCRTCRPITLTDMRFVVCPDCGNKRCPHANDHRNTCTGSNEPGQEGSAYPEAPQQEVKS